MYHKGVTLVCGARRVAIHFPPSPSIARNATTRTSHSLETSVTFPLHVLQVLLREPTAVQTLTLVTSLPCP